MAWAGVAVVRGAARCSTLSSCPVREGSEPVEIELADAVVVVRDEPEPLDSVVEIHQQVPSRLRHPLAAPMCGDPGQMCPTPFEFDDRPDTLSESWQIVP